MIAALYVDPDGPCAGQVNVDPWDAACGIVPGRGADGNLNPHRRYAMQATTNCNGPAREMESRNGLFCPHQKDAMKCVACHIEEVPK
jgi:hypothetical protein